MSMWNSSSVSQNDRLNIPRRRFIVPYQHLQQLSGSYLSAIEIYYRYQGKLKLLNNNMLAALVAYAPSNVVGSSNQQNIQWGDMEVVIPSIENSKSTDTLNTMYRALHYATIVAGDTPKLTTKLPDHLLKLQAQMDPNINKTAMSLLPDFFLDSIQITNECIKREFTNISNSVIVFSGVITMIDISAHFTPSHPPEKVNYTIELLPTKKSVIIAPEEHEILSAHQLLSETSSSSRQSFISILVWNCKGVRSEGYDKNLTALVTKHNPTLIILTDTGRNPRWATDFHDGFSFNYIYKVESVKSGAGIWFLFRDNTVKIRSIYRTDSGINATLEV